MDPSSVTAATSQLFLLPARVALRKESEIDGEEELRASTEWYIKTVEVIQVQKRMGVTMAPEMFPHLQSFLLNILYHQSTYFGEKKMFRKAIIIVGYQSSVKRRVRLNLYDDGSVLTVDCGAARLFLKKSAIPHKHAGQGSFPSCPIGSGGVLGYH